MGACGVPARLNCPGELTMLSLPLLHLPHLLEDLVDAPILLVAICPVLLRYMVAPMEQTLKTIRNSQEELTRAHAELQQIVEQTWKMRPKTANNGMQALQAMRNAASADAPFAMAILDMQSRPALQCTRLFYTPPSVIGRTKQNLGLRESKHV
jgi:hypothetical protein